MKLEVFALILLSTACAWEYSFEKIVLCTSSGKTSKVLKCKADESKKTLMLEMNITESVNKMNVRSEVKI